MLLALCGGLVHYFNNVAPGVINSDRRLKDAANAVIAHLHVEDGRLALDPSAAAAPLPAADSLLFAVRDTQGHLLEGDPRVPSMPMPRDASQIFALMQVAQRNVRSLTTRFDSPGGVVLITAADMRSDSEPAARYRLMSTLLWDFVQLDITLVLVWVGIQVGLRPMKRLRQEIAARSPQDLRAIDETSVPRELAPAVITLNRLFATLRASVQSQQQFIANTAHQLRTPITGLQAQLDLLMSEAAAAPVKGRLLTLQEGIRQLAHSANQLLTLARADPTVNMAAKNQNVALDSLAGEVAAKFFDRALQANIDLGVDTVPAALRADPALIDDLLSNLVDNALKYTQPGGTVTISTGSKNQKSYLAVEDSGPGIPELDRHRVLQRFYRLPNSPGHGSGLGLAIVDEIARLYDGRLTISAGSNATGTRVMIEFP
jgi:two-component system, OmpR family, sensor histidine kinase TctE